MSCDSYADAPERGIFITFEGGDGAGKTTHIRFLAQHLRERGREVVCLREPGGTAIGERLRDVVLDPDCVEMCDRTELFVYEAARAQIVAEVILPALARGAVVLCDRFCDSTVAYQVFGRGLPRAFVDQANRFATQGLVPDRTILMTTGERVEVGLERATRHHEADRMELAGLEFHERVTEGFRSLAESERERVRIVVSRERKSETSQMVFSELSDLFPWMRDEAVCSDDLFASLDRARHEGRCR